MEHFLEGTVVLRYLLNKDTLSTFLQRAAIKDKNVGFSKNISFWGTFVTPPFWRKKGAFSSDPNLPTNDLQQSSKNFNHLSFDEEKLFQNKTCPAATPS